MKNFEYYIRVVGTYGRWFIKRLFGCFMQHWRWLATGISEPQGDDSFDLNQDVTEESREKLYKILSYQPELGYHTGCAHCGGTFTPYCR